MNAKALITIGMIVGGLIGGWVPSLWAAGAFSMWGIVGSLVGGLAGIWTGYRLSRI